jgi:murein L,D-transpeptidase YcbB/YkuD
MSRAVAAMIAVVAMTFAPPVSAADVMRASAAANGLPWFADHGRAAGALLALVSHAELDGLDPQAFHPTELQALVDKALAGSVVDRRLAEERLSEVLSRYADAVARPRDTATLYVDSLARPRPVSVERLIAVAAASGDLARFIQTMGWMHPYYAALREELQRRLAETPDDDRVRRLRLNLERARVLPRGPAAAIVVNVADARLGFFKDRRLQDSMRVVVGKSAQQTPMMAGAIRYAIVNPYWHVPPDLARERIAPRVLKEGLPYLKRQGYQVVTEWSDNGRLIDPRTVDWQAVVDGRAEVLLRQLPGPANSMGTVKFMFPNELGIYLHDSPSKELFQKTERQFSGGCVRLEDAARLQRLLLGNGPPVKAEAPEHVITLPAPVPVYLTYLTLFPRNGEIVERPDVYGRDRTAISSADHPSADVG